jgi:hypothetical protein
MATPSARDPIVVLDLDASGSFVESKSQRVIRTELLSSRFQRMIPMTPDITDIFIFAHGWRNTREHAREAVIKLADLLHEQLIADKALFPRLDNFKCLFILIRWPSMSNPLPNGYRLIRERAHMMTTHGQAEFVIAHILGYLNSVRRLPSTEPPTLQTRQGQYLHCIGHSFGGRFLCEAIMASAEPTAPTLAWPWTHKDYPYTVDTLLVFQMATRPDDFADRYASLLRSSPISGPVVLTFSHADRALGLWHKLAEGSPGLGAHGATAPRDSIQCMKLPPAGDRIVIRPSAGRIVNVDCTWCFRRGRFWRPEGAHGDIWHPESANLVLSLADGARP